LWYEPEHPVFQELAPSETLANRPLLLDEQSFAFALQQFYPCQAVTISGWGEPLRNPHWRDWLAACEAYTKPVTQLYSHADWEPHDVRGLWEQPLDRLTIQLVAHTPSAALSMAQPTSLFSANKPLRLDWRTWQRRVLAVEALMAQRPKKTRVFAEVALLVDAVTVFHVPEMIAWAKNLGVDGVRLENRYSLGSGLDPLTLTTLPSEAIAALREMMRTEWPLHVEWPTVWEASPDVLGNGCQFLNTTVFNVKKLISLKRLKYIPTLYSRWPT
jgi:MoaA/NifB/PqqE/SkfB family radical SAM enzyme